MDDKESAAGAKATDPLYAWWFAALPALFGAASQRTTTKEDTAAHPAAGHVSQALGLAQQLLNSVSAACFGALVGRPAGEPLAAFERLLRGRLAELREQWTGMNKALADPAQIETALHGLTGGMTGSVTDLLKPIAGNLDRAYGGVADAFGLAPLREIESAGRNLALAALAQRRARAEYLDVALDAANQGVDALIARLARMGERGETVDTMLALMRLCAATMDGAMHEAMQSPRALQASAEAIRAGLQSRQQQQRIVAIVSQALNVPTRAEVDEAYREIQELKREMRRLRKSPPEARSPLPKARRPPAARSKASEAAAP